MSQQIKISTTSFQEQVSEYLLNPDAAPELEEAILGAILLEKRVINDVATVLSEEAFCEKANGVIYTTFLKMWRDGSTIDLLTVTNELKSQGWLQQVGGAAYVAKLTQRVGSAMNVVSHARIVQQKFIARKCFEAGLKIMSTAADKSLDLVDVLSSCNAALEEVNQLSVGRSSARHIVEIANDAVREAEERVAKFQQGRAIGYSTGITELDKVMYGFSAKLYIIAARPSMGKTAFSLFIARSAAEISGANVCIYSLEMTEISLADRMLLQLADVRADDYRLGRLCGEDFRKLEIAISQLRRMNIYIDGNSSVTIDYIASHSQMMKNKGRCDMIIVDYLQIIDAAGDRRSDNREREVARMTKRAKQISKDLNVPFVMLSQLSRQCENRTDKRPVLSDLRDSGSIEQDADDVMFLYRPAYYKIDAVETSQGQCSTKGLLEIIYAKQRDGALGSVPMWHNYNLTRFRDWSQGEEKEDLPF